MAIQTTQLWAAACTLAAALAATGAAAQTAPPPPAAAADDTPSYLTPPSPRADNPLLQKTREFQAITLSGWMFYPEFLAETIFNDNLGLTSAHPRAAAGVRLTPNLYARRDDGVSTTELYGSASADLYPGAPRDDEVNGAVSVSQTYKPAPDLTIKGQVELDRIGGYGSGGDVLGANGQATSLTAPAEENRAQASAGVQKSMGRFFLGAAVSVAATRYDPLAVSVGSLSQSYRNSVVTTLTERAGYWISPLVYSYLETAENARQCADAGLRSQGLRAVAGLGSDRLGLVRGEAFAGYQTQVYATAAPASASSPVLGAKLYWYPSRALSLTAGLDETFTDSANPEPGNPRGAPARDIAATFDVNYQLHRQWSINGLARIERVTTLGAPRVDTDVLAVVRLNYALRRNVDLSLSYSYIRVDSNAAGGGYVDDLVSLGARYRF